MGKHTIPICYRNGESGKLEITDVTYDGPLEAKTMRRVNKLFLEKAGSGYFYPQEPLDAYHDVWLELERKAANLPPLAKASPHTYLSGTARLLFLNWFKRKVEPARKMYRAVEDKHYGKKGAVGIDDFDIDNYDGTQDAPSAKMASATERGEGERLYEQEDISAQVQGESLRGKTAYVSSLMNLDNETVKSAPLPDPDQKWKDALATLMKEIDDETIIRAFRAYILADGNFPVAAVLADIPKTTYYRKWPMWIAKAKKVGNLIEGFDTIWYRR